MLLSLFNNSFKTFFSILLFLSIASCATSTSPINPNFTPVPRRIFIEAHVYSATLGTPNQFYDPIADKILGEDVWVFRSDGTYFAIVNINGKTLTLSGVYSGDDTGNGFIFSIETNNDHTFDELLYTDDSFSYIEWRRESSSYKYYLAK